MGQLFSISVPQANVSIQAGSGVVEGVSLTTSDNVFTFSGVDTFFESGSDMKLASTGLLGAAGSTGVVMGSPATIQASAGGAVQLYAGAGITPSIGGPGGPGAPFGPSEPAQVHAGEVAESLTRVNDGLKAVGDLVGVGVDLSELGDAHGAHLALGASKAVLGLVKGGWDLGNAAASPQSEEDAEQAEHVTHGLEIVEAAVSTGEAVHAFSQGDTAGGVAHVAGLLAKGAGLLPGGAPMSGEALKEATAAQQGIADAAALGGHMAGAVDGPRIHQVAPANIDREVGMHMTAKVAGDKTTAVDGKIEYKSGASISMKAFTKVETSSLNFEAYANVGATMKGLVSAKVESLGQAVVEGKAKFKIATMAGGTIEASKLKIEGKATIAIESPSIKIGKGTLDVESVTTLHKKTTIKGITHIKNKLTVDKKTTLNHQLKVSKKIQAGGNITTQKKFKNRNFSA